MGARNPDVEAWLAGYENPQKPNVICVAAIEASRSELADIVRALCDMRDQA